MRLRHIEVFHAVMQAGTISGAAQVLHISQPAVTKVLQHCELQLGLPLFERIRGKLYPRPEAHRLFAETERLVRDLAGIRRLAATLKTRSAETVRLVATPSLALSLLPPALAAWREAFPHTQCELATQHTDAGGQPMIVVVILNHDNARATVSRPIIDTVLEWVARTRFAGPVTP